MAEPRPLNPSRLKAFEIIRNRALQTGHVELSSGRKSDFYFDIKLAIFDPEGAEVLARMVLNRLTAMDVDYIGGLESGSIPITSAVTMLSYGHEAPLPGFFVRKKAKGHGLRQRIEGIPGHESLNGKKVVILDDVATSGRSSMLAVEAVRDRGAKVVLVLAIVDREEGAAMLYENASVKFDSLFRASEFISSN